MTTLSITRHQECGNFRLLITEPVQWVPLTGILEFVPFGSFSTRPDPIRRAWAAVEAKRGMRHG